MIIGDVTSEFVDYDDFIKNNEDVIQKLFSDSEKLLPFNNGDDYDTWAETVVCLASMALINNMEYIDQDTNFSNIDMDKTHSLFNILLVYYYVDRLKKRGLIKA